MFLLFAILSMIAFRFIALALSVLPTARTYFAFTVDVLR
jgi:hypothetical protein